MYVLYVLNSAEKVKKRPFKQNMVWEYCEMLCGEVLLANKTMYNTAKLKILLKK